MDEASSSIIPLVVDNVPPLIFIEARLVGSTSSALISQLGLSVDAAECSVAFMTRTSTFILITGAGWYAAYRLCTSLLGNRFVSVIVDGSQCNQLSTAERRLLYQTEPIREENEEEGDERRQEREEEGDIVSECEFRSRVSNSSTPSEFSMSRVRRSMRARGLFSIGSRRDSRSGVIRREGAVGELSPCGSIDRPDIVPSGIHPRIRQISGSSLGVSRGRPHSSSSRCSDASASLNIVWENNQQQWDDEFAHGQNALAPSPSMGDLCSIFDDVMSVRSDVSAVPSRMGEERSRTDSGSIDLNGIACRFDRPSTSTASVSGPTFEDSEDLRINEIPCMRDSSYMYRSVVVGGSEFGDSDAMSTTSRMSSRFRRELGSNGLWNITSPSPIDDQQPSTSSGLPDRREGKNGEKGRTSRMEMSHDSGLAMMKSQSSKAASSIGKRSTTMFDSAIDDADLSISGDSENDVIVEESSSHRNREEESTPRRESRPSTSTISIAPSIMSLEWDDNGEEGMKINRRKEMEVPVERVRIGSWSPPDSRDLMVFGKERFSPKSGQFKALSDLYSRRRCRRLGRLDGSSDLHSLLLSSIYHQVTLHRSSSEETFKRLRRCFSNYNCLKGWKIEEAFDLLERLRSIPLKDCAPDASTSSEAVKGMRLLMALTICELFDKKMNGSQSEDWITVERPDEVIDRINTMDCFDEMEWRLASESFFIRIERFDFRTPVGASASLSSSIVTPNGKDPGPLRTLPYLSPGSLGGEVRIVPVTRIVPLYSVPDD